MSRPRRHAHAPESDPVKIGDAFQLWTAPQVFAEGHPLRRSRCIKCGMVAGGRRVCIVALVLCDPPECVCGQITTLTQVICADHEEMTGAEAVEAFTELTLRVHPRNGEPCRA